MSDTIRYISKVEIKGLWGKYDIDWNLNPDVNVLSGINGSGKSTILNCVYKLITYNVELNNSFFEEFDNNICDCKILFNTGDYIEYKCVEKDNIDEAIGKWGEETKKLKMTSVSGLSSDNRYHLFRATENNIFFNVLFQVDIVNTFDTEIKVSDPTRKILGNEVKTELDWQILQLQKEYLNYQLNIGKRIFNAISKSDSNEEAVKIKATQERFLEILDVLFKETGKSINREENEISFSNDKGTLIPYQLSSGEKQMLIILLTVLVQDNKNAILFLDEPEISLHFDWQKKLIGYIRELNPNVQIILATHSPAVIMEGWMDKVANVADLIKPAHKSEVHAG